MADETVYRIIYEAFDEGATKVSQSVAKSTEQVVKQFGLLRKNLGGLHGTMAQTRNSVDKLNKQFSSVSGHVRLLSANFGRVIKSINEMRSAVVADLQPLKALEIKMASIEKHMIRTAIATKQTAIALNKSAVDLKRGSKEAGAVTGALGRLTAENKKLKGATDASTMSQKRQNKALGEGKDKTLGYNSLLGGLFFNFVKVSTAAYGFSRALMGISRFLGVGIAFQFEIAQAGAVAGATAKEFHVLSTLAVELGRVSLKTATDVAQAEYQLASLGVTIKGITQSLEAVITFAEGAAISTAESATALGSAIKSFNLAFSESTRVADIFQEAIRRSALVGEDFKRVMAGVGPVAALANQSIEDTVAALGLLRSRGLRARFAAAQVRQALFQIISPSNKAKKALESLNINLRDVAGNLKPLPTIVNDLTVAMQGMNNEVRDAKLTEIFGRGGFRAVAVLMQEGAAGVQEFSDALRDSAGSSKEVADVMRKSLQGQVLRFRSELEALQIDVLTKDLQGFVESIVRTAREIIALIKNFKVLRFALIGVGVALAIIPLTIFILGIAQLITGIQKIIVGVKTLTAVTHGLNAAMAANPIGLVIKLLLGLTIAIVGTSVAAKIFNARMKDLNINAREVTESIASQAAEINRASSRYKRQLSIIDELSREVRDLETEEEKLRQTYVDLARAQAELERVSSSLSREFRDMEPIIAGLRAGTVSLADAFDRLAESEVKEFFTFVKIAAAKYRFELKQLNLELDELESSAKLQKAAFSAMDEFLRKTTGGAIELSEEFETLKGATDISGEAIRLNRELANIFGGLSGFQRAFKGRAILDFEELFELKNISKITAGFINDAEVFGEAYTKALTKSMSKATQRGIIEFGEDLEEALINIQDRQTQGAFKLGEVTGNAHVQALLATVAISKDVYSIMGEEFAINFKKGADKTKDVVRNYERFYSDFKSRVNKITDKIEPFITQESLDELSVRKAKIVAILEDLKEFPKLNLLPTILDPQATKETLDEYEQILERFSINIGEILGQGAIVAQKEIENLTKTLTEGIEELLEDKDIDIQLDFKGSIEEAAKTFEKINLLIFDSATEGGRIFTSTFGDLLKELKKRADELKDPISKLRDDLIKFAESSGAEWEKVGDSIRINFEQLKLVKDKTQEIEKAAKDVNTAYEEGGIASKKTVDEFDKLRGVLSDFILVHAKEFGKPFEDTVIALQNIKTLTENEIRAVNDVVKQVKARAEVDEKIVKELQRKEKLLRNEESLQKLIFNAVDKIKDIEEKLGSVIKDQVNKSLEEQLKFVEQIGEIAEEQIKRFEELNKSILEISSTLAEGVKAKTFADTMRLLTSDAEDRIGFIIDKYNKLIGTLDKVDASLIKLAKDSKTLDFKAASGEFEAFIEQLIDLSGEAPKTVEALNKIKEDFEKTGDLQKSIESLRDSLRDQIFPQISEAMIRAFSTKDDIKALKNKKKLIEREYKDLIEKLKDFAEDLQDTLEDTITDYHDAMIEFADEFYEAGREWGQNLYDGLTDALTEFIFGDEDALEKYGEQLIKSIVGQQLRPNVESAVRDLFSIFGGTPEQLGFDLNIKATGEGKEILAELDRIKTEIPVLFDQMLQRIKSGVDFSISEFKNFQNQIITITQKIQTTELRIADIQSKQIEAIDIIESDIAALIPKLDSLLDRVKSISGLPGVSVLLGEKAAEAGEIAKTGPKAIPTDSAMKELITKSGVTAIESKRATDILLQMEQDMRETKELIKASAEVTFQTGAKTVNALAGTSDQEILAALDKQAGEDKKTEEKKISLLESLENLFMSGLQLWSQMAASQFAQTAAGRKGGALAATLFGGAEGFFAQSWFQNLGAFAGPAGTLAAGFIGSAIGDLFGDKDLGEIRAETITIYGGTINIPGMRDLFPLPSGAAFSARNIRGGLQGGQVYVDRIEVSGATDAKATAIEIKNELDRLQSGDYSNWQARGIRFGRLRAR